ncbi:hypothetical protein PF005_g7215 [Phytophthora fragariae]|uniref:Uncharacterized protein n=1 Tax=Phytophthora fragariae TaxID=53985 RepID=A0A6A3F9W4_9STRA|nr:hypothetical protein PF009_g7435 [Phytophthora fragariae]KAE9019268.1 hypothetical protein PF011_g5909 [Phytophthora fragariae]KAE9122843.1 hypothetical protein PF007_g7282 [Phytophthora fragariae]KAE9124414.1 hypothetical protein PF010_g6012 [Phytophthora fragariae]KAE9148385.1 hypothetical protein PF006_g7011 [Phytophthora fragariae]
MSYANAHAVLPPVADAAAQAHLQGSAAQAIAAGDPLDDESLHMAFVECQSRESTAGVTMAEVNQARKRRHAIIHEQVIGELIALAHAPASEIPAWFGPAVEAALAPLQNEVDRLANAVANLANQVTGLENQVTAMGDQVSAVQDTLSRTRNELLQQKNQEIHANTTGPHAAESRTIPSQSLQALNTRTRPTSACNRETVSPSGAPSFVSSCSTAIFKTQSKLDTRTTVSPPAPANQVHVVAFLQFVMSC